MMKRQILFEWINSIDKLTLFTHGYSGLTYDKICTLLYRQKPYKTSINQVYQKTFIDNFIKVEIHKIFNEVRLFSSYNSMQYPETFWDYIHYSRQLRGRLYDFMTDWDLEYNKNFVSILAEYIPESIDRGVLIIALLENLCHSYWTYEQEIVAPIENLKIPDKCRQRLVVATRDEFISRLYKSAKVVV